ncbi:MAG: Flp pilus assembly protein CpaB [Chloroflexota bacterium]
MEMEFKDTGRRRRLLLIGLGATLAIAAGYGAFRLASNGNQAPVVVKEAVLVAARDIPARSTITADDVTKRDVPTDEILGQTYRDPANVVGRVTSVPIYADQQMTPSLFATSTADSEFSILGPDETVAPDSQFWRAVSIRIPDERAVGGEVQAGQHVDLIVSVDIKVLEQDPNGNYVDCSAVTASQLQCGTSTKITFQDLDVLKVTPDDNLYVFKVDLRQAEQIAHIIQEAPDSFTLVLRPDEDTRPVDSSQYGTTTDRLIMYYLYPVPQLIDLTKLLGPSPYPGPGASAVPGPSGSPTTPVPSGSPGPSSSPQASAQPSATP